MATDPEMSSSTVMDFAVDSETAPMASVNVKPSRHDQGGFGGRGGVLSFCLS